LSSTLPAKEVFSCISFILKWLAQDWNSEREIWPRRENLAQDPGGVPIPLER